MTSYDTITDGTNTVTFEAILNIQETIDIIDVKVNPYPESEKQQIYDVLRRGKFYTLTFLLVDNGDTAYTQLQTLKTIWKTKHTNNKYLRKITFAKPGTVVYGSYLPMKKIVYGYIQSVTPPWDTGADTKRIVGDIKILQSSYTRFEE